MKIELNITGIAPLATAINNLAAAISSQAGATPTLAKEVFPVKMVVEATEPAPGEVIEPKPVEVKETPAQKEKRELCEKIVELGGTPPEKGAVSKFRETLATLQAEATPAPGSEQIEVECPTPAKDAPVDEVTPPTKGVAKVTLEEARAFAGVFMRQGDVDTQKPIFARIVKEVGATNLTGATPKQLAQVVEKFTEETGMTLAEALKVAAE